MFKNATKIKSVAGLAGAALVISYFITNTLITSGKINTTLEIGMILCFLIIIIPTLLLFAFLAKKKTKTEATNKKYKQTSTHDKLSKQSMKTSTDNKNDNISKEQNSSFGFGNEQKMD